MYSFVADSVGLVQQFICNAHAAGLGTHCNAEVGDEERRDDHVSIEIVTVFDRIVPFFSKGFDLRWTHLLPVFRVDKTIESLLFPGSAEVQILLLFFSSTHEVVFMNCGIVIIGIIHSELRDALDNDFMSCIRS